MSELVMASCGALSAPRVTVTAVADAGVVGWLWTASSVRVRILRLYWMRVAFTAFDGRWGHDGRRSAGARREVREV
jgi:hypothetical protein